MRSGFVLSALRLACVVLGVRAAQLLAERNARTLWVAHRRELVQQASTSIARLGLEVGAIMAGIEPRPRAQVQVASIQTMRRREKPPADLIVVDECHHARAQTYRDVLDAYPGVPVLGLTATPFRLDGKGLGDVFGEIVVGAFPDELCADGTLIEPIVYAPAPPGVMDGVHIQHGDYNLREVSERMRKPKIVGDLVRTWHERAAGKRTVLFAPTVAVSKEYVEAFKLAGVRIEHLDGKTPKAQRDAILHRLRIGYTTIVSNVAVVEEGFDLPALDCAIVARPTASLCLHLQMIGRIMRACEGKGGCIAEGSLVLTEDGLVPIERVSRFVRVWDGVEWVHHGGPVCTGERDVITYSGLTATPDHRCWTAQGWKAIGECSLEQIPLAQTGLGRAPVRISGDYLAGDRAQRTGTEDLRSDALLDLRCGAGPVVFELERIANGGLPCVQPTSTRAEVALLPGPGAAAEVPAAWHTGVPQLRSARDSVPFRLGDRRRDLGEREPWAQERSPARQDRQQRPLRAWECPLVDSAPEHVAHQDKSFYSTGAPVQDSLPARSICGSNASASRLRVGLRSDRCALGSPVVQTKRRVWDLLNAGPRHRFTVSDLLVHNSIVLDHAGNHLKHGPVTQRLEYSLADRVAGKAGESKGAAMRRCPKCYLMMGPATPECPGCGYVFVGREIARAPGELVEYRPGAIAPRPSVADQQQAWGVLESQRVARGYREGWTFMRFKDRFGFSPLVYEGVVCDPSTVAPHVERAVWERIDALRRERGHEPGFTAHQFKDIFGRWPQWRATA